MLIKQSDSLIQKFEINGNAQVNFQYNHYNNKIDYYYFRTEKRINCLKLTPINQEKKGKNLLN